MVGAERVIVSQVTVHREMFEEKSETKTRMIPAAVKGQDAPILVPFYAIRMGGELQPESEGARRGQSNAIEVLCRAAMAIAPGVEFQPETGGCNGGVGHLLEECRLLPGRDDSYFGHVIQLAIQLDEVVRT